MDTTAHILLKASNFSAIKHRHERRKDAEGTPYINHPIGVAWILSQEGKVTDLNVLQAALLHDTVEDTDTTFEELEREFGPKVASIVREVTDDKSLGKEKRKQLQVEHAAHASTEAKLVKLADKLYNLRDLLNNPPPRWSVERLQGYALWSEQVINAVRGTNALLEKAIDAVFATELVLKGQRFPLLPTENKAALLQKYYLSMSQSHD